MKSIPQATGRLENALRVLLDRQLAPSRIPDYCAWVAMNLSTGAGSRIALCAQLERNAKCDAPRASATITELIGLGLLNDDAALTPEGDQELTAIRHHVKGITDQLTAGLNEADIATTVTVLEHARARAESILTTT